MKTRIISAIIACIILIPIMYHGGLIFNICAYLISLLGLKELLDAKSKKREVPLIIRFISYVFISLIILVDVTSINVAYSLDYRIISALFLAFLLPVVLYNDKQKYNFKDAFYMIGSILFLGISMALLIMLRAYNLKIFAFIILLVIATDSFSYISDYLTGKRKMLPQVSDTKSWEGLIIGVIMGSFISVVFYHTCINAETPIIMIGIITVFLSLIGQIGDLTFSSIKKYFGIEKFSKLIPGHGGVLDRLDSTIFVLLGFTFFITLI